MTSDEGRPIDWAIQQPRRRHAIVAQASNEGHCFPVTMGD